jgi:hypothetical protein
MDAKRDAEFEAEISLFEDHNADIPDPILSAQITQLFRWRNQVKRSELAQRVIRRDYASRPSIHHRPSETGARNFNDFVRRKLSVTARSRELHINLGMRALAIDVHALRGRRESAFSREQLHKVRAGHADFDRLHGVQGTRDPRGVLPFNLRGCLRGFD